MNNKANIDKASFEKEERKIDILLDNVRQPYINNSEIKHLVWEKLKKEKTKTIRRRILGISISSVAAVTLIVFFTIGLTNGRNTSLASAETSRLLSKGYKEIIVPRGKRIEINLSDGSYLVANHNSKVIYPEKFNGKERKIYVDGEVYVNVAKDIDHPFIVESPGFEIKVLGTKFNIDNCSDTTSIIVLVEGSIDLSTSKQQTIRLRPNDLVDVVNGEITELRKVDALDYISWIKGLRSVNGETMKNLTRRLSEFYGVTINCDEELSETKIYGKLDLRDSLNNVLSSINNIVPMEIKREGNCINLRMSKLN